MGNLYHKDIGIPAVCRQPVFEGRLYYTLHAQRAAVSDRYGAIPLPEFFVAAEAELIEVEAVPEGAQPPRQLRVVKQVWRQSLDATRDLVLVIVPEGWVKTVWVNRKDDDHPTLQRSRYVGG